MERIKINSITIDEAKKHAVFVVKKELCCNVNKVQYLGGGSFGYIYKVDMLFFFFFMFFFVMFVYFLLCVSEKHLN